jgi:single-strand DNA-binding protein
MNTVILQGNLASDVEIRKAGKHTVGRVLMAVSRPGKDKGADFIRVVMWNKTAENSAKYLQKGSKISVEGHIRGEFWEKDGKKNLALEVVANQVTFLDARPAVARSGKAA